MSATGKKDARALLEDSVALKNAMWSEGIRDNSAIDREFDGLWGDLQSLMTTAHNKSGQRDALTIGDLEFQSDYLGQLEKVSTDPILSNRLKQNKTVVDEEISGLKEQELIEPQFGKLSKLIDELGELSPTDIEGLNTLSARFYDLYREIQKSGKLKYDMLSGAVTMIAGLFNMIVVGISNEAQESVAKAMRAVERSQGDQRRKLELVLGLSASATAAIERLQSGRAILARINEMQIDPKLKSTIRENLVATQETINSLEGIKKQIETAMFGGSRPSSGGGGGCYVATAVYGSYDCPEVWTLRRFRDYRLARTPAGRCFIRAYYAISPRLVKQFGESSRFRRACKKPLDRLVAWCTAHGLSGDPYDDQPW